MLNIHEDKAKLGRLLRSQEPREGDASNIILTTFGHYLRFVLARLRLLLRAPTGLTALNGAS
jgi:hypothetical protein